MAQNSTIQWRIHRVHSPGYVNVCNHVIYFILFIVFVVELTDWFCNSGVTSCIVAFIEKTRVSLRMTSI